VGAHFARQDALFRQVDPLRQAAQAAQAYYQNVHARTGARRDALPPSANLTLSARRAGPLDPAVMISVIGQGVVLCRPLTIPPGYACFARNLVTGQTKLMVKQDPKAARPGSEQNLVQRNVTQFLGERVR
jgi:hypothetical protein